ncbi:hypothetical protein L873DRAFT_1686564, partial [Choiromyces venosus 120613-1]
VQNIIPKEYAGILKHNQEILSTFYRYIVLMDGWTDKVKRSLHTVLVLLRGRSPVLLKVEDMNSRCHTWEEYMRVVKCVLEENSLRLDKMTAVITDSPSVMT